MKKFSYRMENLLQIKLKLEDQAKIAYSSARQRLTREEEKLERLTRQQQSYEEELRALQSDRLDITKIRLCEQAIEVMKQSIKQQRTAVKNAQHRLEVAGIRLNAARMERKTQERLREKALEEYMLEFEAEERKETDERNSFHYSIPELNEED